ncbi:exodeoxyribonuclease I [Lamprobacter modestohalophilus]|uniref:Exodeoxyribonuclease I n=1 Tax=Lamprobacter modestohalophilus TaxID=1064514 RepID=A0A9X0W501_9GAMM|nr:exodeoxyribonuclease I [Lamprobacter modestohalophilus]MBK1617094.1 exodeoxyribonuclease I [Lamprobacter modestohalophilus]
MAASFYWYDYETWGSDPALDRPCQFAGLRTDADLNVVGEPLLLFARPAADLLPQPEACFVTGMTPDQALEQGLPEAEFARLIQQALATPGSCSVGYNSLRFDDRVNNWLFYRNLLDPYAHAWQNGNSRWDLIDVLRLAHALRPQGIQWPEREPGVTSFKLEALTAANAIEHVGAHDALADVRATLALARRLKAAQPRLFAYALNLRDKAYVAELLASGAPLLHVSARYAAAQGCIAPVLKVATNPSQKNQVICFDLRQDPAQLLDLSAEALQQRLFTRREDLPTGVERLPAKGVKINASPMLAPLKTLTPDAAARWQIDLEQVAVHAARADQHRREIAERLGRAFSAQPALQSSADPERMLYTGGFFSDQDRRLMDQLGRLTPSELAQAQPRFEDSRLPTLLFRMRARSWPETLSEDEREDWDAWRFERLTEPHAGASITIDDYEAKLASLRAERVGDENALALLDRLERWGEHVMTAEGD